MKNAEKERNMSKQFRKTTRFVKQSAFCVSKFGNGPNTVSESTVSNTELSEFFGAH